jgi:uncharacterized protein YdeI (YjbR/CyaY-like superfamily)
MRSGFMVTKKGVNLPTELEAALKNAEVLNAWKSLRPSCQREYVKWVEEAKKAETRERRVDSVVKQVIEQSPKYRNHRAAE